MTRLCFLVVIAFLNSFVAAQEDRISLLLTFKQSEIIPDVLSVAPAGHMTVQYPNSALLSAGDVLTPSQVKYIPWVTWDVTPAKFYTVVKTDPDVPSRENPMFREWLHWLVVNIPGDTINAGDTVAEYVGAGPGKDTGLHRYVFLVYEQPYRMMFDEPRLTNRSMANRTPFSVSKFAKKYNLGDPIAGTFYQAEWDEYVPILYQKLGAGIASGGQRSTLNSNMIVLSSVIMVLTMTLTKANFTDETEHDQHL